MSGITSSVGIFSGIDSASLISQLLQIESRPKVLVQQRIAQLQLQQSAYLDINGRLNTLRTAASSLRTNNIFSTAGVTSSKSDVLTGTASTGATAGSYSFLVDRLVSTRQVLSRGFADKDRTALNATSFTFETDKARLDRDVSLASLNGGEGVARGKIRINDSQGGVATIDLSRVGTVSEVLEAINTSSEVAVTASVRDGRLIIADDAGGSITVANGTGSTTATSLGIAGTTTGEITGSNLYYLAGGTALSNLNDGNGVFVREQIGVGSYDFTITVNDGSGDVAVRVNLGTIEENVVPDGGGDPVITTVEGAVGDLEGTITRINDALADQGITGLSARISSDGLRVELDNTSGVDVTISEYLEGTTARDLGFTTGQTFSGTDVTGRRLLAGLDSTLLRNLNGGAGIAGDGALSITARDGSVFSISLDLDSTSTGLLRQIETATGGKITGSLSETGTGLTLTDTTGGGGNLIITGTGGQDTAESLGISTGVAGVASSTVGSGSLQMSYVTLGTRLEDLNGGLGVGTGSFRVTDDTGATSTITLSSNTKNVRQLLNQINTAGTNVRARINQGGDGIELYTTGSGTQKIKVEDTTGAVAKSLNIAGEASGTGSENTIDGTSERTVEFEASDTLADIARKINEAKVGAAASVINTGNGASPFRLSITSTSSGASGRFVLDSGGLNLGLEVLDEGNDARVFFGSSDPAKGVLLSSSSNTLDGVIDGVSIDLKQPDENPVTLTVSKDTAAIESKINEFISAFNSVVERIDFNTRYVADTNQRGNLLGDSTVLRLRQSMFAAIQNPGQGLSGDFTRLVDVGLTFGDKGKLSLDSAKFREALESDPEGVEALFVARDTATGTAGQTDVLDENGNVVGSVRDPNAELAFTSLGVAGVLEELVKTYTDSIDGVLTTRNNSLKNQIELQNNRVAALDVRLENRRLVLSRQFLSMEQAIGSLQSQQASLGQIKALG